MDKIEEVKKLLWILDSKHNVSIPQTKENIDFIADEIVKLFCQPAVSGRSEQLKCQCKKAQFTRTVDSDFNPLCGRCGKAL